MSQPRASDSMGLTRSDAACMHATAVPQEPLIADRIGKRRVSFHSVSVCSTLSLIPLIGKTDYSLQAAHDISHAVILGRAPALEQPRTTRHPVLTFRPARWGFRWRQQLSALKCWMERWPRCYRWCSRRGFASSTTPPARDLQPRRRTWRCAGCARRAPTSSI